jgi:hypothetical protein
MNGVGIRSTLTPLVRSESGRIHVGSEKGPELLQRTDAGPSTDGVGSLQESREMDHSEVASFLFSWKDKNGDGQVQRSELQSMDRDCCKGLEGHEILQSQDGLMLHTRTSHVAEGQLSYPDLGWLVAYNPNTKLREQGVYPLGIL